MKTIRDFRPADDKSAKRSLVTALDDKDCRVREVALIAVRGPQNKDLTPKVCFMLGDPAGMVRDAAAITLLSFDNSSLCGELHSILRRRAGILRGIRRLMKRNMERDCDAFAAAAKLLQECPCPSTVKTLIAALRDPERFVRHAAAEALGALGAKKATNALCGLLLTADNMRSYPNPVLLALYKIQDPGSFGALIQYFRRYPDDMVDVDTLCQMLRDNPTDIPAQALYGALDLPDGISTDEGGDSESGYKSGWLSYAPLKDLAVKELSRRGF